MTKFDANVTVEKVLFLKYVLNYYFKEIELS